MFLLSGVIEEQTKGARGNITETIINTTAAVGNKTTTIFTTTRPDNQSTSLTNLDKMSIFAILALGIITFLLFFHQRKMWQVERQKIGDTINGLSDSISKLEKGTVKLKEKIDSKLDNKEFDELIKTLP